MIKRIITQTVTEYDKNGEIIKKTVTETTEDDGSEYLSYQPQPAQTERPSSWDVYQQITGDTKPSDGNLS